MRPIDIEVIDDFVSPSYLKELQKAVDPINPIWYFQSSQSITNYDDSRIEDFGFTTMLCPTQSPDQFVNTPLATLIRPLTYQIQDYVGASHIVRCRLDMTLLHSSKYTHPPHIDIRDSQRVQRGTEYLASIIYINDTDGDTIIYDHQQEWAESYPTDMNIKTTVAPKPGRMLLFDGSYVHTGESPSEHQTRILLNTVLS